jgi:hypothetical protein
MIKNTLENGGKVNPDQDYLERVIRIRLQELRTTGRNTLLKPAKTKQINAVVKENQVARDRVSLEALGYNLNWKISGQKSYLPMAQAQVRRCALTLSAMEGLVRGGWLRWKLPRACLKHGPCFVVLQS